MSEAELTQIIPAIPSETQVARYMGLAQFLSLLETRHAFFPSVGQLRRTEGNKGDHNEGRLNPTDELIMDGTAELLDYVVNQALPSSIGRLSGRVIPRPEKPEIKKWPIPSPFGDIEVPEDQKHSNIYETISEWIDVWCWHQFSYERIGMWRQYGQGDGAICLISTVGDLLASLKRPENLTMQILPVDYRGWYEPGDPAYPEFRIARQKSNVYEDEREVRVIAFEADCNPLQVRSAPGRSILVDLDVLCQKIIVHPDAPDWAFEAIEKTVSRHLTHKVSRSQIYEERRPW